MDADLTWSEPMTSKQSCKLGIPHAVIETLNENSTRLSNDSAMAEVHRKSTRALRIYWLWGRGWISIDGRSVRLRLIVVGILVSGLHGLGRHRVLSREDSPTPAENLIDRDHIYARPSR